MSRIGKAPVSVPAGVEVKLDGRSLSLKGPKGSIDYDVNENVTVSFDDGQITFAPVEDTGRASWAIVGTMRSIVSNHVAGVSEGVERKLQLVGVGYRAKAAGSTVNLALGFSHPVDHQLPDGVTAETPSNTEIILRGVDKQLVGQVAADIRAYRPPEPYKGKGVRYSDEHVVRKEAKKK